MIHEGFSEEKTNRPNKDALTPKKAKQTRPRTLSQSDRTEFTAKPAESARGWKETWVGLGNDPKGEIQSQLGDIWRNSVSVREKAMLNFETRIENISGHLPSPLRKRILAPVFKKYLQPQWEKVRKLATSKN